MPIPRDRNGTPVDVFLNVSILAFPAIDTAKLKYTVDFFLNMRWYDLRVEFRDLNDIRALNSLSNSDKENIWVPQLDFVNALGATQASCRSLSCTVVSHLICIRPRHSARYSAK